MVDYTIISVVAIVMITLIIIFYMIINSDKKSRIEAKAHKIDKENNSARAELVVDINSDNKEKE